MWLCAAPILYPFPVRVLTAKNNSHYLLITLTFYQRWVAGVHVPQLEDSCQSAARAWREVERWRGWPRRCSPAGKRAFSELPCCPHDPAPSRPNWEGADRGSAPPPQLSCPQKTGQDNRWHLPSYPTPGPETIQTNNSGQWTWDTCRRVINVTLQLTVRTKGGAVGSTVLCHNCNCTGLLLNCLSVYINRQCSLALLALQLLSHYSSHMFYLCRL